MAVNVDKALYEAPLGIAAGTENEPTLEVEIQIEGEEVQEEAAPEADFYRNLADEIDEGQLQSIAATLLLDVRDDIRARQDWEKMYMDGINLLGLKYEMRTDPWQGACGVFHPMITEAVIRFQSDTIMETFPAKGPVKTTIIGKITEEKQKASERVEDDLNWQVMENMPEFRPDHERLMWNLPSAGCGFKKVYECPILKRPTSSFVPAEDVIIPYGTSDLLTCERIAHRMKKTKLEMNKIKESGFWRDVEVGEPAPVYPEDIQKKKDKEVGVSPVIDTRYTVYEVSVDMDLDFEEGEKEEKELGGSSGDIFTEAGEPYIVTVLENTNIVLSIRRNWKEGDPEKHKRLHFVQYNYIPGYGAYGFGLFHLLGGFAQSATSIMRQLVDAGTLSNLPGGLKSKGLRIKGDDQPVSPGEFRDVDVGSGTIRDNILPLPYKEPSATLYNLLLNIVEEARRFAATNDLKITDMSSQAPVGTTLAILERQLRTMTAVQARVHFSFKQELRLLADLIKEGAQEGDDYAYEVDAPLGRKAKLVDYSYVSIIPVSDPNAATMSQRVVQYQAAIQLAGLAPQIYDQPELHRQMLTVLGIKNVGKLIPTEEDIKIVDPVQENQNILIGKPVRAFHWQDHESHIRVHQAAMIDPLIQQLIGQNPQAQKIMASGTAHIAEHVGFAYRVKMQKAMGLPLPVINKDDNMPEHIELQLSKMLAQAAPMVLDQSKQVVAQQQAQQNAQDPVLVAQRMEQENAKAEIQRKSWKDQQDVRLEETKLTIDAQAKGVDPATLQHEMMLNEKKVQNEIDLKGQQFRHKQETDGVNLGIKLGKERSAAEYEKRKQSMARAGEATRTSLELTAKNRQISITEEKHRQDIKLREEKHTADMAAKKKMADAAARAKAQQPKPLEKK
jgi:hypothetical protein